MMRELQPEDPQLIGPYRLRGRLGAGGMGRVFLGVSAGGRSVAVKVIRAELASDPEFRLRFRREVDVARRVSGLFTAPVIDADLDGPVPWLATAYVRGLSLAEAVSSHGPWPAGSVLALAAGLAEGLSAIHAAGVVHRDLKPANVLLADDGPRVIDFGISRAVESSALTSTGLVVGSPGFMSPEQADGREVGPASDIFSLGAILAYAATGTGPFGSGSTPALVYRVVYNPPNLDRVPAEVRPLIERCLAKDPARRPTAADVLAEAGAVYPAMGWLPEPVTRAFTQVSAPAHVVTGLPVAPVGVTSAPTTTAAIVPPPSGTSHALGEAQRPRRRPRRWRPLAAAAIVAGVLGASATAGFALTGASHPSSGTQSGQQAASVQTSAPVTYAPVTYAPASSTPVTSASARASSAAATVPYAPASAAPSTSAPATSAPAPSYTPTPTSSASSASPSTSAPASTPATGAPATTAGY
jgi:eukaryotic-like serine/threonine-protein kinase